LCEASFASEYGVDLRVVVDEWTPRRLWAYLHGLPADAAVWRDHPNSWTGDREAMATLIELMSQGQIRVQRPTGEAPTAGRKAGPNVVSMQEYLSKFSDRVEGR
jgi:hypothetical protein